MQVLKQCGDDLTRENVMKQAANLKDVELGMLLPGIKVNTSPTDYFPLEEMQMRRFNGERWEIVRPDHQRGDRQLNGNVLRDRINRRASGRPWRKRMHVNKRMLLASIAGFAVAVAGPALAQKKYDTGATDTEIKIGNTNPYSGPASAYGTIGKTIDAYFKKVNAEGGINGRKINFITYDDGYSPPKAVEQVRKLVESDEVLLVFQPLGTPSNTAIQKYMNSKKVPQLFVATGATKWGDPKGNPWTMGWQPNYQSEGRIYAEYLMKNHPNGKIGILYQNDDYGKDYVKGLKDGLGTARCMIVSELPYEPADPTVDSQIINLKASGADVFFNVTTPKFAAQAIKKAHEIGWKPVHLLNNVSNSVGSVIKPAGLEASKGVLVDRLPEGPDRSDLGQRRRQEGMARLHGQVLSGRRQDLELHGLRLHRGADAGAGAQAVRRRPHPRQRDEAGRQPEEPDACRCCCPASRSTPATTDFAPIKQMQMQKFNGERWELFGPIMSGDVGS